MEDRSLNSHDTPSRRGLAPLEWGATGLTVVLSVAAAATQQAILTAIAPLPLSLAVGLNLVSRKKLDDQFQAFVQQQEAKIAELVASQGQQQSEVGGLTLALSQVRDRLEDVQQQLAQLGQGTQHLHDYTRILDTEQKQIEQVLECLREIEKNTQVIQTNPSHAKAYYNRGLTHQRLGDAEAAILDYSEAIRINENYAKAYHNRGVARSTLGDRKGAVEDLRTAAKLFFEQGDISSYQRARDLAKRIHEVGSIEQEDKEVPLEILFS
ncbi:tetratricopeptide repeat protein [Thermosynechococcus sp. QKsg1]|uniref:tetratricopeptide repeat protein n=1 Tax=unclassified Thermosynechococcus TaxID=2622553 RepID=UPI00122E780E|nr:MULTISPECIES: tetratricopeptide repeat protein [unclassified Thermosynechococcus]QEQ00788.1 tetratricopeptide repeat protein [Thermosynechococcus sp. CL-1]WJI25037.1 tetratricopeptide repeat protein [Thermosynechococcus sp. B0]WKT84679.1 tetratricopeptide repeat protein [Thermosynechococcus sp. HY596]WNC63814.1 tetratricopeptide repeat protein [Thermosynechococcus sp. HY591]WNC66378.1 tetratricopeptide repeat protein [Thermosynechococcus sp. HY593]